MHLKRSLDIHIPAHVQQDLNSATPSEKTETRISDLRDELTTILTQLPEALRLAQTMTPKTNPTPRLTKAFRTIAARISSP